MSALYWSICFCFLMPNFKSIRVELHARLYNYHRLPKAWMPIISTPWGHLMHWWWHALGNQSTTQPSMQTLCKDTPHMAAGYIDLYTPEAHYVEVQLVFQAWQLDLPTSLWTGILILTPPCNGPCSPPLWHTWCVSSHWPSVHGT